MLLFPVSLPPFSLRPPIWAADGHGPESTGTVGQPRELGPEPESPGRVGRHYGTSVTGPSLPLISGQPRWPSDPGLIRPRQLVDTVVPGARARVTREGFSTLQALEPGPELPGTAG